MRLRLPVSLVAINLAGVIPVSATRIEIDHVKFKTLFDGTFHEE